MPFSTQEKIDIGRVCGVYSSNEIAARREGGLIDLRLPSLLNATTTGLEWLYELDPSNEDIDQIGNYLISICRHIARAQYNLNLGSGGSVAPVNPVAEAPEPLDFIVDGSTPIVTGASSVTLTEFIGWNIDLYRNGVIQYTTNPGSGAIYYSWNKITGLLTLLGTSPEAGEGEQIRIVAVS